MSAVVTHTSQAPRAPALCPRCRGDEAVPARPPAARSRSAGTRCRNPPRPGPLSPGGVASSPPSSSLSVSLCLSPHSLSSRVIPTVLHHPPLHSAFCFSFSISLCLSPFIFSFLYFVYLSVSLSLPLSLSPSCLYISSSLFICLSFCVPPSICLSTCLFISLFLHVLTCLCVNPCTPIILPPCSSKRKAKNLFPFSSAPAGPQRGPRSLWSRSHPRCRPTARGGGGGGGGGGGLWKPPDVQRRDPGATRGQHRAAGPGAPGAASGGPPAAQRPGVPLQPVSGPGTAGSRFTCCFV